LLLRTREVFYRKATERAPGFEPFVAGKLLCDLEQAVSACALVSEQTLVFFSILTVFSPQIKLFKVPAQAGDAKIILEREMKHFGEKNPIRDGNTMWQSTQHEDLS